MVSRTADLLGRADDARRYDELAEELRGRVNRKFLDPQTGLYSGLKGSQTAHVLPLALDIAPDDKRNLVFDRLVDAVHGAKDHLNTGFIGTPFLLQALSDGGRPDLAASIVSQRDYPSWATLMNEGVFKETWKGEHALMPSLGGAVGAWFYKTILGIRPDPEAPGFRRVVLKPEPVAGVTWARGHHDTRYGRIGSNWRIDGDGEFVWEVRIPANTTATVYVPAERMAAVRESGVQLDRAPGVTCLRFENGRAILLLGSGAYRFTSRMPGAHSRPPQ